MKTEQKKQWQLERMKCQFSVTLRKQLIKINAMFIHSFIVMMSVSMIPLFMKSLRHELLNRHFCHPFQIWSSCLRTIGLSSEASPNQLTQWAIVVTSLPCRFYKDVNELEYRWSYFTGQVISLLCCHGAIGSKEKCSHFKNESSQLNLPVISLRWLFRV